MWAFREQISKWKISPSLCVLCLLSKFLKNRIVLEPSCLDYQLWLYANMAYSLPLAAATSVTSHPFVLPLARSMAVLELLLIVSSGVRELVNGRTSITIQGSWSPLAALSKVTFWWKTL